MKTTDMPRGGYDVFISHNHANKDWIHKLSGRLADVDYNGRALRPWLDGGHREGSYPSRAQ